MKKIGRWVTLFVLGLLAALVLLSYHPDVPPETLKAKYATAASQFVTVGDLSVHYRDEGPQTDSVPLVLLHGTGASLLTWDGWVVDLGRDRRVIRLDLPAYGLTGPNRANRYSGPYYVQFLRTFLTRLNIRRCVLAGNSLGGAIAWQYALMYPEAVEQLILVDAGGYPVQSRRAPIAFRLARVPILKDLLLHITPRSIVRQSLRNVYADPSRVTKTLVDQYMDMALRQGNRKAFVSRMAAPLNDSTYRKIPAIGQRTLILWGAKDGLIPVTNAYRFHRDLPNDTLVVMPNAGHVPMEELPDESVQIVRAFLRLRRGTDQ